MLLFLIAAFAGSAVANPSPFCGRWVSNCVPDYTTGVYINTTLSTQAYTYPNGLYPAVDYAGSFGSIAFQQYIYSSASCSSNDLLAVVFRFGDWTDLGSADQKLFREIALSPTSMKIRPASDMAVTHLQTYCPCGNATAWKVGVLRTITACHDSFCALSWVNYSNIGSPQYGLIRADVPTKTMNVTAFSADPSFPSQDVIYSYHRDEECTALPPQSEPCGNYLSDCRASVPMESNVKVSFNLVGNSVGQFMLGYDYYDLEDTSCSTEFSASVHITGTYALHGPSNCSGTCKDAQALEVFASSTTIVPGTQAFVDLLNNLCQCNGTWALNAPRTITVCPIGTCNLAAEEFTHGIPVGTIKEAYGNILAFSDQFLAVTQFTQTNDYANSFGVNDHVLVGSFSDACAAGKTKNALECGQYISTCQGSADRTVNFEENSTFFGPGLTGQFRRVYRQFPYNDRFCSGPADLEYIMTGTYTLADQSTCEDCTNGAYSKFEVSITRSQFTLNTQDALDAFKASCPCSKATTWRMGEPNIITTCDPAFGCGIGTFPGVNGLNIGDVIPAYGTITRFDNFVAVTELSIDMPTGFSNSYTSKTPLLNINPQFNLCPTAPSNTVCGVYRDGCRGGSQAIDNDNLVRTMTLYGEQFGEFSISQSMYQAFDDQCTETNINGVVQVFGTFALHGPSDCSGSCSGIGAQQLEMSIAYVNATFYSPQYLAAFAALCPCGGDWVLDQPRIIAECPAGTCSFDIRGLELGSSAPHYGSLLRFGNMATMTMLNPSSAAGYALGFTSEDQAVEYDPTSAAATCPKVDQSSLCGVYKSPCSGYGNISSINTVETISFNGATTGAFRRTFKAYSAANVSRCNTIVLANWDITGTFEVTGPSTCGGTCVYANATKIIVQSATITLTSSSEVEKFNQICRCGGTWAVGVPRTIGTNCDHCRLDRQAGAHGLEIGTGVPAFGSVTFAAGRFAMTRFSGSLSGYNTPFEPATDRVYTSDPAAAAATLSCAGAVSPSQGSSSDGLSAGDGLLIAFFVILGVYLIGGMAFNYRAGATGQDLIPHLSFWKTIPGLAATGCRFAFIDCFGLRGNSAGDSAASYTPVASGRTGYGSM